MKKTSDHTTATRMNALNPGLIAGVSKLADANKREGVLDCLRKLHPADVAVLLSHLSPAEAKKGTVNLT